jgi:uncharacterized membrane protein YfhO
LARVVSRSSDTLTVAAELREPGVLVVSEAYDEGWAVDVGGRPADLLRANGLFRAVRLGAGVHEVHFSYRPWPARAGAVASAVGASAALALALAARGARD